MNGREPFDEERDGSIEPPPPEIMYVPARNVADFDHFPPGWEEATAESRMQAHERSAELARREGDDAA
jgi:hypothetical protein